MSEEAKVCMLCLQTVGNKLACAVLNNADLMQKLDIIGLDIGKNLELIEDPVLCSSCDDSVQNLAAFKSILVENEIRIAQFANSELLEYLKTLSENVDDVCRFCLTAPTSEKEHLDVHFLSDITSLLSQCKINLEVHLSQLNKICNGCFKLITCFNEIILLCSKSSNLLTKLAINEGKLTSNELLSIADFENIQNAVEEEPIEESLEDKSGAQNKVALTTPSASNVDTPNVVFETNMQFEHEKQQEVLNITRTPNTYKKKDKLSSIDHLKNIPSTSKADYSLDKVIRGEDIVGNIKEQLNTMYTSIDASPVKNISDITLNLDEKGVVEETTSECNATQELIDVLEGRLNDQQVTLDVLQDLFSDDTDTEINKPGYNTRNFKKSKSADSNSTHSSQSMHNYSDEAREVVLTEEIDFSIPKTEMRKRANNKKFNTALKVNSPLKQGKIELKRIIVKSCEVKPTKIEDVKCDTSRGTKKPNILRKSRPRSAKIVTSNKTGSASDEEKEFNTDNGSSSDEENGRQKEIVKKRGKISEIKEKSEPQKKKAKKTAVMKITRSASKEILRKEEPSSGSNNAGSNDVLHDVDKICKNVKNRPVQVTIIKGKRKTNKAELDKTWQALTRHGNAIGSDEPTEDIEESAELFPAKKKRGRPPKANKKNLNPNRSEREWVYCDACPYKTYSKNSFIQHQLIHNVMSSIEVLNCNVCAFNTSNAPLMEQHKLTHETQNLSYKCIFCDDIYKRKTSCMYHTLRHDDQDVASQFYCLVFNETEEYFECYQCDYQNPDEASMPDHVIDHTVEVVKNPIVAKYKCKECPYRTKTEGMLERHMHLHDEKRKKSDRYIKIIPGTIKEEPTDGDVDAEEAPLFKCGKCEYATRQKRSLSNHIGLKHNRAVPPTVAGQAAMAKATAEGLPMYFCNECSYSTYRKMNMPRHVLVHRTKDTMEMFECPHCIFETKHRRSYTRHMEVKHAVVV